VQWTPAERTEAQWTKDPPRRPRPASSDGRGPKAISLWPSNPFRFPPPATGRTAADPATGTVTRAARCSALGLRSRVPRLGCGNGSGTRARRIGPCPCGCRQANRSRRPAPLCAWTAPCGKGRMAAPLRGRRGHRDAVPAAEGALASSCVVAPGGRARRAGDGLGGRRVAGGPGGAGGARRSGLVRRQARPRLTGGQRRLGRQPVASRSWPRGPDGARSLGRPCGGPRRKGRPIPASWRQSRTPGIGTIFAMT